MADDIYIGGGPGKHLKQPNPPVKPRWDTDPPETEPISGGATAQTAPYNAPRVYKSPVPTPGSPNIRNNSPEDFMGMRGIKRVTVQ